MSEDEDRPGPDGFPSLSTHTLQCGILFRKYIAARGTGLDKGFTKEQSDRFMDWTEDLGVFGPHLATLDYELRFRADVSYQIHGLLDDLYDRLLFVSKLHVKPSAGQPTGGGDGTPHTSAETSSARHTISNAASDVDKLLKRLEDVADEIQYSAVTSRGCGIVTHDIPDKLVEKMAEVRTYTEGYIAIRCPKAPQALRETLAEVNARRLVYILLLRQRLSRFGVDLPLTERGTGSLENLKTAIERINRIQKDKAHPGDFAAMLCPEIPASGICPYCGVRVGFERKRKLLQWRSHLLSDLEPYLCLISPGAVPIESDLDIMTFNSRTQWNEHMRNDHNVVWECHAFHTPIVFKEEALYRKHVQEEHTVTDDQLQAWCDKARKLSDAKFTTCPFGGELCLAAIALAEDVDSDDEAYTDSIFATAALERHVYMHLLEIALLTLAKLPSAEAEGA